jgi:hypothetical protein
MAEQSLFTWQDAIDHLRDVFDIASADVTTRNYRSMQRAVDQSYRDLPRKSRWSYYERRLQIQTVAAQSTGTITYEHAGGTYEREVTLSGATWPTDSKFYNILIDNERYKIEDRKSTTVITLNPDTNPGADVAAGTSYDLFRANYPLPVTLRRASPLVELAASLPVYYIPPNQMVEHAVARYTPQQPLRYTIRSSGDYYGGAEVEFSPPPLRARTYDFMGEVEPRALGTFKYNSGTVTITSGQTTVTLSGGTFTDGHVGDIIRFSSSSTAPTGLFGDPDESDNPYTAQRVILSKDSDTTVTIDETVSSTLSSVAYVISSPLDIPTGDLFNYLLRLYELQYMRLSRFDFKIEEKREKQQECQEALLLAMTADNKDRDMQGMPRDHSMYSLRNLARPGTANAGTVI